MTVKTERKISRLLLAYVTFHQTQSLEPTYKLDTCLEVKNIDLISPLDPFVSRIYVYDYRVYCTQQGGSAERMSSSGEYQAKHTTTSPQQTLSSLTSSAAGKEVSS